MNDKIKQIEKWYTKNSKYITAKLCKKFKLEDAQDITQNIAIRLLDSNREWVKTNPMLITNWEAQEFIRSKRQYEQKSRESVREYMDCGILNLETENNPYTDFLIKEFKELLNLEILGLDEYSEKHLRKNRDREIFIKKYLQEMSNLEIRQQLNLSEPGVNVAARNAYNQVIFYLRKIYENS